MLTLALPKGRVLDPLLDHFEQAGLPVRGALDAAGRALVFETAELRVLLLKDADVPVYVEQGVAHCGVVGLDQVLEHGDDVLRVLRLPFAHCRLCLIAREGDELREESRPLIIATKYPRLATRLAAQRGRPCHTVSLAGSVELAARLRLADAVLDVVETGRTLRENGLHPVEEWLQIAPYLIANRAAYYVSRAEIGALRRRLGGRT